MSNPEPTSSPPPDDELAIVEAEVVTSFRFRERPESLGLDVVGCLGSLLAWPWLLWVKLAGRLSADATYHVPTRFGMSAILGITTLLALLYALFRAVDAHPLVYAFSTALLLIVVVVQMRWGHVARPASIVAGAIWFPLFILTMAVFMDRGRAFFWCLLRTAATGSDWWVPGLFSWHLCRRIFLADGTAGAVFGATNASEGPRKEAFGRRAGVAIAA